MAERLKDNWQELDVVGSEDMNKVATEVNKKANVFVQADIPSSSMPYVHFQTYEEAIEEGVVIQRVKDEYGNEFILYPVTKMSAVEGLSQALANVYSPENKPTAADIGALSTGGGTVTGFTNFTKGITLPNNAHNPNANCYSISLPNGYKVAWGSIHISGGGDTSGSFRVNLPASFPSVKYHIFLTPNGNSGESTVLDRLGYHSKYSDNFQIGWIKANGNYGVNVDYFCIGY